ncbi:hypothetical protein H6H05_002778 [Listeria monocytogenes]|nr:hypothetical protein [Listeria monocytogenes]EGJ4872187.1 hypothetical protein [Listeria monocytogenes]
MKNYLQRKFDIQHFAEGGDDKKFSQAELDEIVKNRVAAEKRKFSGEIETIKSAHEDEIRKLNDQINQLNDQVGEHGSSEKALKKLQKEKDEALSKLDEYVQKEQTAEWYSKLKESGVKEERYEAFTKLFGDEERNDDNLAKFAEQYPEWIAKSDEGDTPPPIGAGLGNASEPSATDPFIQALNS